MNRAAIFNGPNQPFEFIDIAGAKLAPGEVRVHVSLATICGSDLHTIAGLRTEPTPCVLGHEAVGIVEAVNGDVKDVHGNTLVIGDRVVWSVGASCGTCFFCTHDLPQKCETLRKYGHVRQEPGDGPRGSMASHVHLWPGTAIVPVPDHVPDEVAAPAACATATVAACFRQLPNAESVLILGAGMLGLTACAMAHANGLKAYIVDASAERIELAKPFGAAAGFTLPAQLESLKSAVPDRGVDAVLEFTGSTDLTNLALSFLRTGGTLVLAGAVFPTPALNLTPEQIIRRWLTIRGVHNYAPRDLTSAVEFLAKHHRSYPFADLVAHRFSLKEVDAAVAFARKDKPIRAGISDTLHEPRP